MHQPTSALHLHYLLLPFYLLPLSCQIYPTILIIMLWTRPATSITSITSINSLPKQGTPTLLLSSLPQANHCAPMDGWPTQSAAIVKSFVDSATPSLNVARFFRVGLAWLVSRRGVQARQDLIYGSVVSMQHPRVYQDALQHLLCATCILD